MKILHVVRSLIRNNGVAVFAYELARAQADAGHDASMLVYWMPDLGAPEGTRLVEDRRTMAALRQFSRVDYVHIHAIWGLDTAKAMMWCKWHKIPYVVSPHGGLMPRVFGKGRVKKWLVYHFLLKPLINGARAIHCTGKGEVEAVRALGIRPRTFIAPLGCRLPTEVRKRDEGVSRTILFLGRLGEEKGLELLLDAWKKIQTTTLHFGPPPHNWKLVIAGPSWLGYGEELKKKVEVEKIGGVEFPGPADEAMKDRLYRAADVFVLSSPMENFSMVVLDALAYGVPVICTKGTPWRVIAEKNAGWWIEPNSVEAIRAALEEAMKLTDEDRRTMGQRGREIAREYTWPEIAKKMEVF